MTSQQLERLVTNNYLGPDLRSEVPQKLAQKIRNALPHLTSEPNGKIVVWEVPENCSDQNLVGARRGIYYANGAGLEHLYKRTRKGLFKVHLSGMIKPGTRLQIGKAFGFNPNRARQEFLTEKVGGTYENHRPYFIPR